MGLVQEIVEVQIMKKIISFYSMNTCVLPFPIKTITLYYFIGPAVHKKDVKPVLVGTSSFGDITCHDNTQSFYTNILLFQNWMELTMMPSGTHH